MIRGKNIIPASGSSASLLVISSIAMTFLAVCIFSIIFTADRVISYWADGFTHTATVQIPAQDTDSLAVIIDLLETTPHVGGAHRLTNLEVITLLQPWFDDTLTPNTLEILSVPHLIDVTLEGAGPNSQALSEALQTIAPGATYEPHDTWRTSLLKITKSVRIFAVGTLFIVVLCTTAIVILATRASLASHSKIINVLQVMGAEDKTISQAFERRILEQVFIGASIGFFLSTAGIAFLTSLDMSLGVKDMMSDDPLSLFPHFVRDWFILGGIPILFALIALVTTRCSVLYRLKKGEI